MVDQERRNELGRAVGQSSQEAGGRGDCQDLRQEVEGIAQARSAASAVEQAAPLALVVPPGEDERLVLEKARATGAALARLSQAGVLDRESVAGMEATAVTAGQLVGRPASAADQEQVVAAGRGLRLGLEGEWRAEQWGYLCLEEERLSVRSPVWVEPRGLEAYWLLLDDRSQPATRETIREGLAAQGVVEGLDEPAIERLAAELNAGGGPRQAVLLAVGTPPQPGEDAQVEFLVAHQRLAGKEREDGSLDFRELNFAATVQAGQVLAQRRPATPGQPGRTVRGEPLAAPDGVDQRLTAGEQVTVSETEGVELFTAAMTGAFVEEEGVLAVVKRLHIDGNADFHTGNLDFDGELCISGSVVQGFAVKAASHIAIAGTVEAGAQVTAGGDVSVGLGIVGNKTQVAAQGTVRAQFVQEAMVTAAQDILLGSFAYQAQLRAGGRIRIGSGRGGRRGSVVGGHVWARHRIETLVAGSPGGAPTRLMAGVDQESVLRLDQLRRAADETYNQVRKLMVHFGLVRLDVEYIKKMIAAARGERRKLLTGKARRLGELVQLYQQLAKGRTQLEKRLAAWTAGAEIWIYQQAFPGVEIRLGEHQRQLTESLAAAHFRIVDDQLVER